MLRDLAREQEVTGNVLFLYLQIAGKLDDFHAVLKRGRDAVQGVRRGDEKDLGQIVINIQIMIVERLVLLGIEDFKEGGGGIAAIVRTHLVDFVEAEKRIAGFGALQGHDDFARHGPHVGAAMPADFRLVAHAAEGEAHVFASGGAGHGLGEGGLAHAGRPDEAEDGALERVGQLLHGEEFEDALLGLFKAEMLIVEDGPRFGDVESGFAHLVPRQFQNPVEIVADNGVFRRGRGHHAQLLEFGQALFAGFLRHVPGLELLLKLGYLGLRVVVAAHFLVDGLDLLGEVVFTLVLVHLVLDAALDAPLHGNQLHFGIQELIDFFQPLRRIEQFQRLLLFGVFDFEQGEDGVRELPGVAQARCGREEIRGDFFVDMGVFRKDFAGGAHEGLGFGAFVAQHGQGRHHDAGEGRRAEGVFGVTGFQRSPADAVEALEGGLDRPFGEAGVLEHAPDHPDLVEIGRAWRFQRRLALRDEADALAVIGHGGFDGLDRGRAAHEEGHDRVRRHDHLPQGHERQLESLESGVAGDGVVRIVHAGSFRGCGIGKKRDGEGGCPPRPACRADVPRFRQAGAAFPPAPACGRQGPAAFPAFSRRGGGKREGGRSCCGVPGEGGLRRAEPLEPFHIERALRGRNGADSGGTPCFSLAVNAGMRPVYFPGSRAVSC